MRNFGRFRIHTIGALAITAMVLLAGCSALGGPSVSDPQPAVSENGQPYLAFDYSVDDYATALLEGPEGQIIAERKLSPDKNTTALPFSRPREGTYTIAIQQGGDTAVEKSVEFTGPETKIEDVEAHWSGSTLQSMDVTIKNDGDLPVRISNASVSARDQSMSESPLYQWVEANGTETVSLTSGYSSSIEVAEPGKVHGTVEVDTPNETVSDGFEKTFEGPNLTIQEVGPVWGTNSLQSVSVWIRNDGDMATTANVSVRHADEVASSSGKETISAGERVRFSMGGTFDVYHADSAGNLSLDLVVDSESRHLSKTLSHRFEEANLTLESATPSWNNGELESVTVEVQNHGDFQGEAPITITVDGDEAIESMVYVEPDTTAEIEISGAFGPLYSLSSGGDVEVTATLSGAQGSGTVTATQSFEEVGGEISSVETTFSGNYDSNTSDLWSVDFTVQNTGEVKLQYDSVRFSIDGVSKTESLYRAKSVEVGSSRSEYLNPEITVDNGQHELTIELLNDGETVVSKSTTASTGE